MELVARLLYLLVEHIGTEADLIRTIDRLDNILLASSDDKKNTANVESAYQLLEQLVVTMHERFQRDRLAAIRLVPYIKVLLGEAQVMLPDKKEPFVERCLTILLAENDTATLQLLDRHISLWPSSIQLEWQNYIGTHALLPIAEKEARNKEAAHLDNDEPANRGQKDTPSSPSAPQQSVGSVNGREINYSQFRKLYALINLYLQYEHDRQSAEIYRSRGMVAEKEAPTLLGHEYLCHRAIDNLVSDFLIQEGIEEALKRHGVSFTNFDTEKHIAADFQRFKAFQGEQYAPLLSTHQMNDEDITDVLRIFLRRKLFDQYLRRQAEPKNLLKWLSDRRARAKVLINYKVAFDNF
jgi:hypothetical protein